LLGALLLLAGVARVHRLGVESLWNDELLSLEASSGRAPSQWLPPVGVVVEAVPELGGLGAAPPWTAVFAAMGDFTHPPLYFVALRFWREAFGTSDAAARSLSVAAGLLSLLAFFDLARTLHGTTAALWGTALMALAGPQIRYAQEARGYTMLLFFGLLAGAALVRIERDGTSAWRLLVLGLGSLAAVATHYYGIGVPASLGLYACVRQRGRARRQVLGVLASGLILFAAAWGPMLILQAAHAGTNPLIQESAGGSLTRWVSRVAGLPALLLTATRDRCASGPVLAAVAYVLPFALSRRRPDLLFWGFWLCLNVGVVAGADLILGVAQLPWIRYTLLAGPAVYALAAALLSRGPAWARHGLPALAAVTCLALLPRVYLPRHPPWRELGDLLSLSAQPGDVLVLEGQGPGSRYIYRALSHYAYPAARRVVFVDQRAGPSTLRRLARAPSLFWVGGGPPSRPQRLLPGAQVMETVKRSEALPWLVRLAPGG